MEVHIRANRDASGSVEIMARAKLTGSLLGANDPPPATTSPHGISAPSSANRVEGVELALPGSECVDASVSGQVAAAVERSGSAPPARKRNRRFGPIPRFGIAIGGLAAVTAVGIVLFELWTGHSAVIITVQLIPPSAGVSNPARATQAPEPSVEPQAGMVEASAPESPTRAGSLSQPATTVVTATPAADPEPPPTLAVAPISSISPISPQTEPAAAREVPPPTAQPAGAGLPAEDVAALVARGDALFGNGDIVSARLFYNRAAEEGDVQAVLRLGMTYDPAFLARARMNGAYSDAEAAAQWYRQALALGAADAHILLSGVAADDEVPKGSRQ